MIRDSDYEFIRKLVYQRSRINLGPDKRELVASRLNKRLLAIKLPSISEYCDFIQARGNEEELGHLIDVISTNHTYFFREKEHFDHLYKQVLPEMVQRQTKERWRQFAVWSAACSSGEEPYSIAILLAEYMRKQGCSWPWLIHASDISNHILAKARAGIFREAALEKVPKDIQKIYFEKGHGPQEGNYRIKPSLAQGIRFHQLNLLEASPPGNDLFHVIFCRNVMIYFDHPTQQELVTRLCNRLVPGGYLFVGHSESLTAIQHSLTMIKPAIYRRSD